MRRPWGLALLSLLAGVAAIAVALGPLLASSGGVHGFAFSTIGVGAILIGLNALRRNRRAPSAGVLATAVAGIGAGAIGSVAMLGMLVTSPGGPTLLPFAPAGPVVAGSTGQWAASTTQVTLTSVAVVGVGPTKQVVVGNGGSVRLAAGYSFRSATSNPQLDVRLERRVAGGGWTATGIEATVAPNAPLTAATPAYSTTLATEAVQYRFASGTSASAPVSVVYENQHLYTGMAATIYADAAPYCPNTAVEIAHLGGREAGDYAPGALLIRISTAVGVRANLTRASQRALALHECSHERQWLNYGGSQEGYAQMKAAAAADFTVGDNGAPPIEHAADCGAMALEPNGYLGYGGFCTRAELNEGARLLNGQEY
ncbi:hypothetical protein [Amnibacterium sp.]|uniref:hypothetical protein n=1 Tax=Amnibacterium sp. TaxID=1872496 RepID=UPI003F7C764B